MAKCGCASSTVCPCVLTAGSNVTISGTGQAGDPWVVNANATPVTVSDTTTVDLTLTGVDISGVVKLEPANNLITTTANGLLVSCATITAMCNFQPKLVAGNGINPTQFAAGTVAACLSTDAGNQLSFGTDGCLFVTAASMGAITTADTQSVNLSPGFAPLTADVIRDPAAGNLMTIGPAGVLVDLISGCGLSGEGTAASPLVVHTTGASPYSAACGGKVYCETATGKLTVDPEKFFLEQHLIQDVLGGAFEVAGPGGVATLAQVGTGPFDFGATGDFTVTNPSACRKMQLAIEFGVHHSNLRIDGPGRTNVLAGAYISAAGAGGVAFAQQIGNAHTQWMRDSSGDPAEDNVFDSPAYNILALAPASLQLNPSGSVTFTIGGQFSVQNYNGDSQIRMIVFARVIGYSL